ncbi:DUF917 family protein [Pantoea sp. App145]|uniref:S-methyl thiohydantoin desulfurase domain-containing protein n=1 Tax=Pantoea sp. App145 TaxID=3071567 RepID=UPI003A801768
MRELSLKDVQPAMYGGLLLSAGGSGVNNSLEKHDLAAEVALGLNIVKLAELDEIDPEGYVLISTSVGAPGFAQPELVLKDHITAAENLIEKLGRKPAGVMCGHVPGFNGWLVAAALDLPYIDAAANGRGHPTVKMGGMGLASRPDISIVQVAQAGFASSGSKIAVVAEGNLIKTSQVMRHCATISGGLVASARGPYQADFIRENGAAGAISFQIELGKAMLSAPQGLARASAAAAFMGGEVILTGKVVTNDVVYQDGFDIGFVTITDGTETLRLGVYNEYMTAEKDDARLATFPDMIGSVDAVTGDPIAISTMKTGQEVSIIIAHHSSFPLGKGALDPVVFAEIEQGLGLELYSYINAK